MQRSHTPPPPLPEASSEPAEMLLPCHLHVVLVVIVTTPVPKCLLEGPAPTFLATRFFLIRTIQYRSSLDPYNPVQEQPFDEDQPQAKSTIAAAKESFNVVTAPTASLLISDENCGEIQKLDEEDPGAIERYRDVVMNGRLDPAMMYHMDIDSQLQYMTHLQQLLTKNETDSKNLLLPRLLVSNRQFRLPKHVSVTVLQVA